MPDCSDKPDEQLFTGTPGNQPHRGRWILFAICSSLFIISMLYRMSSAVIAEDLSRDLALDPRTLGLVGGIFFYAFAAIQIPLGPFLDRVGARVTMISLNVIGIIGAIVFSLSTGAAGALMGRSLIGIGMAANLVGPLKLFINWFDLRRFATLSGLLFSLGTIGGMFATSPLALLSQTAGWRNSFLLLAGIHGLVVLSFVAWVRETPPSANPVRPRSTFQSTGAATRHNTLNGLVTLFKDRSYWAISWSIFLRYGAFASIQALWAGPYLMSCLGLSPVQTGNLLIMLSVGLIFGAPAGGFVSDRILRSRKKTVVLGAVLSAVFTLIWSRWPSQEGIIILALLLLVNGFFNAFNQVCYAHIRELMPFHMSGTALAGINVFTMAGGGVFVHGLGVVISRVEPGHGDVCDAYRMALMLCVAAVALSALLYGFAKDAQDLEGDRESQNKGSEEAVRSGLSA